MLENSNKYMKINVEEILKEKEKLSNELKKIGIDVLESYSNTIFTKTYFDSNFLDVLDKNNVSVVPVYDKNNNLHIRIAVQDKKTNIEFIKKIKQILKDKKQILGVYEDN